ncbi:MAG: peptidoglycan-binding protein [Nitratireductor sp.]|nr:peptidoglycan-binding protein [Nitratireductor sp.]
MKRGLIYRIFSVLQNNPSAAAGGCTFLAAFALVAGNIFFAQSGAHPDPIWATRDMTTTQSVTMDARPVRTTSVRPRAIPVPARPVAVKSELIEGIQAALARTGDFSGTVDGLNGPVTRAAIAAYQKRNGLPASGNASPELLALIESTLPKTVAAAKRDRLSDVIATSQSADANGKAGLDAGFIRELQTGLARATGAEIDVDGILGSQTEAALKRFQQKHGLSVTGKPDTATLDRLARDGLISRG